MQITGPSHLEPPSSQLCHLLATLLVRNEADAGSSSCPWQSLFPTRFCTWFQQKVDDGFQFLPWDAGTISRDLRPTAK